MKIQFQNFAKRQTCSSGTWYYVCSANGFMGCCSVDPCALSGCPDASSGSAATTTTKTATPATTSHISSVTNIPSATPTTKSITTSTTSTSATTTSASGTSSSTYISDPTSAAVGDSQNPSSKSGSPTLAIIAGVLGGLIIIILLSVAFYCIRRRRMKRRKSMSILPVDLKVAPIPTTKPLPPPPEPDPVPYLDSIQVEPRAEMFVPPSSPLGKISELAAVNSVQKPQELRGSGVMPSDRGLNIKIIDGPGLESPTNRRHIMSWNTFEGGLSRENSVRQTTMSATLSPAFSPGTTPVSSTGRWSSLSGSTVRESTGLMDGRGEAHR